LACDKPLPFVVAAFLAGLVSKMGAGLRARGANAYYGIMTNWWFALAVIALALLATNIPARATQPEPIIVCPKQGVSAEVERGSSVRVMLVGFNRNGNRLEYKALNAPRYGKLSQLTQHQDAEPQGPGFVTYTHGNDPDSLQDTFTYECRDPITGQRGRGRVTITIVSWDCRYPLVDQKPARPSGSRN
jgi:hypothetical protein